MYCTSFYVLEFSFLLFFHFLLSRTTMNTSEFEPDDDPFLTMPQEPDLMAITPEMKLVVEDARKLLLVSKTMLIELRLRNIDANNIVALAGLLYERGEVNGK
jgi:hypothetical protein